MPVKRSKLTRLRIGARSTAEISETVLGLKSISSSRLDSTGVSYLSLCSLSKGELVDPEMVSIFPFLPSGLTKTGLV